MKKVILIFSGILFISTTALFAQSNDTIPEKKQQPKAGQGMEYMKEKDWKPIGVIDVPAALRQTLQATEYTGWDQPASVIYKNSVMGYYAVEIHDGEKTKTFRFDKDGKPIKE